MSNLCVVGVYVRDLAAATRFYRDVLGFEVEREFGDCIVQLKNNGVPFVLQKIEAGYPEKPSHALNVAVDNLQEKMQELKRKGVVLLHSDAQPCPVGVYAGLKDPEGSLLELLEFQAEPN
jgi:lactoylglutathione lyase